MVTKCFSRGARSPIDRMASAMTGLSSLSPGISIAYANRPEVLGFATQGVFLALRQAPREIRKGSALLFIQLQIQVHVFAAVKAGDGAGLRFGAIFFRVQLVIRVRIQSAKAEGPGVVADIAADGVGAVVFQKNYAGGYGIVAFVEHHAVYRAQLRLFLG